MPATAAIDNETLDHLLSVVDEGPQYKASAAIRKVGLCHRRHVAAVMAVYAGKSNCSAGVKNSSLRKCAIFDTMAGHDRPVEEDYGA